MSSHSGLNFSAEQDTVPAVPGTWTCERLSPERVKWFYLRPPLSLRDVYGQDVLHRADIRRFCSADSNRLEALYREQAEEIEKAWWVEYSDVGSAVSMPLPGGGKSEVGLPDKEATSASWQDYHLGADTEAGVLVRSGLYEAHLKHRRLDTCYWPEPSHRILRGTWFVEKSPSWVPLKEPTAEELEAAYRSQVWANQGSRMTGQKLSTAQGVRVELQSLHNEAKGWFALFVSGEEAYLCKDDSFSWLSRKLSTKASLPGFRLRRGYEPPPEGVFVQEADLKTEAVEEQAAQLPVNKLLLVVHGIGQNLVGSNIVEDAACVRQGLMANLGDQECPPGSQGRTEVLPVQWRKHLDLDVDKLAASLMPPGIKSLRQILHATAVEVLLYVTPLHCQEMLDSVAASLNLQYTRFMARNPDFKGEISILAHSLGSVLCYDLLCNQTLGIDESAKQDGDKVSADLATPPILQSRLNQADFTNSDSLQPLTSYDLDPSRTSQGNGGPTNDLLPGFSQKAADPFSQSHLGLQQLDPFAPQAGSPQDTELAACRKEIVRLKKELYALRQKHAAAIGAAQETGDRQSNTTQSLLAPSVDIKQLVFSVDRFIAIGSPLGIFLTLRKVNPHKGNGLGSKAAAELMVGQSAKLGDGLPAVRRMYNLYHPYDPVGFRLEPLITAGAEKRRPVFASTGRGSRTFGVGLTELGEDMSAAMSLGATRASNFLRSSLSTLKLSSLTASKKQEPVVEEADTEDRRLTEKEEAAEAGVQTASRETVSAVWRLTDGPGDAASYPPSRSAAGRLDFVLQAGLTESQWLSAMSSHFAYWTSPDVALFIARALQHQDVTIGAKAAVKDPVKDPSVKTDTSPHPGNLPVRKVASVGNELQAMSMLSLPSSPHSAGLLSPTSQNSAKSTSFARGKAEPADWW